VAGRRAAGEPYKVSIIGIKGARDLRQSYQNRLRQNAKQISLTLCTTKKLSKNIADWPSLLLVQSDARVDL